MIATLSGTLHNKSSNSAIIDVGGVGYHVNISISTYDQLPALGDSITLDIHTHVREDQITLFGFTSEAEKRLFLKLTTVSGIGPKLALTILSGLSPSDVVDAVTNEDLARLHSIPGVGKKTAERIMVDLKDKLVKEFHSLISPALPTGKSNQYDDALSALINLGYPKNSAEKMLSTIAISDSEPLQLIIKNALKSNAS